MISLLSCANNAPEHNGINVGESELTIHVLDSEIDLDSIEAWVHTAPIFNNAFENESYPLSLKDGSFVGHIPTELKEEVIGISLMSGEHSSGRILQVRQGINNVYDITIPSDLIIDWGDKPDFEGLTHDDWMKTHNSGVALFGSHDLMVPKQKYKDWHEVRKFENDTLWPRNLAAANLPTDLPEWIENSLRCRFASLVSIPYVKAAERSGIHVDEPPMESYTFLDSISYSEDVFLKKLPFTGLKSFLYALLRFPEGGFEPIGDMPVNKWQSIANRKLSRAITKPTKILLDLLSSMSYVEQIDIKQIPLSGRQIENVEAGYDNGLKDIILNKNEKLQAILKADNEQYKDLVNEDFSLKEYLDREYPGKPVVVDMWGTWCIPCMDAIAKTEKIRENLDSGNVVFLYIATETSPVGEWKNKASQINGEHIRISELASGKIGKSYNLEAFPSYLFFTSSHDLLKTHTGFPGKDKYIELVAKLSTGN